MTTLATRFGSSRGAMSSDRTYLGDAFITSNGQPIGGAYQAPSTIPYGKAQVTWNTKTTDATIVLNGRTFNVTRQQFGFDFASDTQPLLGELSIVEGTTTFFGDRITLTRTQILNGKVWAVGYKTGDNARLAIGRYEAGLGMWTILLDSSTSYYDYFTFRFEGVNFIEGLDYTFLKTALPGLSLPMVGYRTKSAQRAAGQNAPGSEKSGVRDELMQVKAAVRSGAALPAEQMEYVLQLQEALHALQRLHE